MKPSAKFDWKRHPARAALALPAHAQAWDRLNAQRGDLPFLSSWALRAALEVFGDGHEQLFIATQGGRAVAMFMLRPDGPLRWRTFQPSQVPLGAWVAAADLPVDALAAGLLLRAPGLCLAVSITQVDPRFAPRAADDALTRHDDYIETGWLELQGSFDTYWAARGKNLRQNMRKQRNKLAADGIAAAMRVLRETREMAPALARYGQLESSGWKAGQGTAIHIDNEQGRFYRRLFEDAAERGEAVIYEYLFDARTVAMNLCLLRGGVLVVLKTAYDESIKSLSPAFLLREEELQSWFATGEVSRIEYYGRLMDWHTKLTDTKRTLYHLTRFRWGWLRSLAERRSAQGTAPAPVAQADTA